MSNLNSKSFIINKGDTLNSISNFIYNEIGLDAYLIKSIEAVTLNNNTVQLTLLYDKYPSQIIDSIAPRAGSIFTSDISSNDFDIRFLFKYPIDINSIVSGSFELDGIGLDTSSVYVDPNSNNYYVKLSASGSQFQTESFHTYRITQSLQRSDGTTFSYTPVGGYIFHELSSAHIGDYFSDYYLRRRGLVSVAQITISKDRNTQQAISEFLRSKNLVDDRLISFTSVTRSTNLIDVFVIYLSRLEPQIVDGFPLNNSLLPDISAPSTVTLVYNTQLDKNYLKNNTGVFTIEEGFNSSTNVDPSDITIEDDLRTVVIDTSSYFTSQKIYSIISRPGLLSKDGFSKVKPEQWTIHISAYEAIGGGGTGADGSGADPNSNYLLYGSSQPELPNSLGITFGNSITGYETGSSYVISGIGIAEHFANTSNPHSVTTTQIGAVDLSVFTGHTGLSSIHFTVGSISHSSIQDIGSNSHATIDSHLSSNSNPHSVTYTQVGSPSLASFTGHTGKTDIHFTEASIDHRNIANIGTYSHLEIDDHITSTGNPHNVTVSQIGAISSSIFTGHTGNTSIHFTVGSIDHTSILNIGSNTHAQIDTHIASTSNPHSVTASQVGAASLATFTGHTGQTSIHFTVGTISHTAIQDIGTNTHSQIDSHISNTSNPHSVTATQVGSPTIAAFTGHTGQTSIHFTVGSIDHGSIAGLTDDDHTQYLLANGSRTVNGELQCDTAAVSASAYMRKNEVDSADLFLLGLQSTHAGYTNNPHSVTASQVGAPTLEVFTGHTGNTSMHLTTGALTGLFLSIANNLSDISDLNTVRANLKLNYIVEDFCPYDSNGTFSVSNIGAGSAFQGNPYYYAHTQDYKSAGIAITSNNNSTDPTNGGLLVNAAGTYYLHTGLKYYFRASFSHNTNCIYRIGLTSTNHLGTGNPSDGAYFHYQAGASSTNMTMYVVSGGSLKSGVLTSSTPTANTWYWFAIQNVSSGINFYTDIPADSNYAFVDMLPQAVNSNLRMFIQTISTGATYRNLYLDKFCYPIYEESLPDF